MSSILYFQEFFVLFYIVFDLFETISAIQVFFGDLFFVAISFFCYNSLEFNKI